MYKGITMLLLLGSAIAVVPTNPCHAASVPEKTKPAIVEETMQGRIMMVAPELAQLTVASGDKRVMIHVTPETRIRLGENREGTVADLRAGMNVLCVYSAQNQRNQALVVLVLGT